MSPYAEVIRKLLPPLSIFYYKTFQITIVLLDKYS